MSRAIRSVGGVELADRATSLARLGVPALDRSALVARLILGIDKAIARFEQGRLLGVLGGIARRDALPVGGFWHPPISAPRIVTLARGVGGHEVRQREVCG